MIEFFIGLSAYILAGFGLGGGVLLIPMLTSFLNFEQGQAQYIALVSYVPAAISIVYSSVKHKLSCYKKMSLLIPSGLLGAIVGALFAQEINVFYLKKIYCIFMIIVGVYMFQGACFNKRNKKSTSLSQNI